MSKGLFDGALVSFTLVAMGVLGSALFPNAAKAAFQTRGRSIVETIALEGGRVLRREMSPSAKSAWRFGVLDSAHIAGDGARNNATR